MFILTDPTMVSINYIQKAHKQANNNFYDIVSEMYDIEFIKQEKANKEHVDASKRKAIELQRTEEESRKAAEQEAIRVRETEHKAKLEAERIERERQKESQRVAELNKQSEIRERERQNAVQNKSNGGVVGNSWSEVSPQTAAAYMASKTGVPQSTWERIIFAESTNNPTVMNSIGCYGYLQLHPVHGNVSSMTPQQYLDTAVGVFLSQGLAAWEVTTNGTVN